MYAVTSLTWNFLKTYYVIYKEQLHLASTLLHCACAVATAVLVVFRVLLYDS